MALTGIEIYKHLPKTNCKECGFPTCLAFAMKLAAKAVELSLCPYVSEEAKQALEAASRPPIRLVTIGAGERKIEVGNEVVMFRHEKTFYHPPGFVVRVKDSEPADAVAKLVAEVAGYSVERVGMELKMDGFAIENESQDGANFVKCVELVSSKTDLPLILMSKEPSVLSQALEKVASAKPLLYAATKDNWEQMAELALKYQCPLAVCEPEGLGELAGLVENVTGKGVEDVILDPGARDFGPSLVNLTQLRRLAVRKSFRPLGYPIITFPGEAAANVEEEALLAGQQVAKYSGIIVLDHFSPGIAYPLLTLRLNIYTDPQKPIQMTPGIYEISTPKPESPLCVTTNFSLTYFSIAGELESSGFPSWLLVCDTEGLSVLTAWSAGKFDAERIAKTAKEFNVGEKVSHKSLILPGGVAILRGELEEELPEWKIMVGPREAVDVGGFLKQYWAA
ncbi:MAG: acetyl-CoA decarbonylase/synthase complex subunit gamma [Dehalococcoidia bacterium]|jgi:acetyl-CoA decarbonylase/synthase complex subunit gamma|nr:acetyl-CoA decarbonylase/synthase complex subunit gamma [Chloroflexota bacterium]MCK4242456.1 acetyl-CoA decarbonylase/synthase complex subunit gamma [Dehalococcoidia bacterium]